MAAAIKAKHHIEPKLIEGRGGVFDVVVDGNLIYSKHKTGEFPSHDEILTKLNGN